MNALVLVGGQGTRLRPLTYEIPKPLLPIVGRPMIFEIVEWLASHGVTKVVFALGHQSDAFLAAFSSGEHAGVVVVTATEPDPRDTAGAIAFAADYAGVADELLIVINGDIITDLDIGDLIRFHEQHAGSATIALTPVKDPSAFGVVSTDQFGRVIAFIEKPAIGEAPTNMINAGTYVLEPSVLKMIARNVPVSIEREIFPELVRTGELFAKASESYWLDTGTPERYLQAQWDVLRGLRPQVILPDHLEISRGVLAAADARVMGEVIGANFFGARSSVARTASVRDCVIEAGAVIASGTRLDESVVMTGAMVDCDSVIERSIIGPYARIGASSQISDSIVGARVHVERETRASGARLAL
ncbi:MAG TPA: NDP-sugar synthase [Acidimicrobiales bacterium]|nr:NDP-sugar synthase [Acidimicrobiales bacterium]